MKMKKLDIFKLKKAHRMKDARERAQLPNNFYSKNVMLSWMMCCISLKTEY